VTERADIPLRRPFAIPLPHRGLLHLGERPLVMGIVNVTPDSFAGIGPVGWRDAGAAIQAALRMEAEGADLIDIGGESTRPGAEPVSVEEECGRVLPVVAGLAGRLKVPISIDTYKAEVARAALEAGAGIVNDISGLRYEPTLAAVAAERGAALVLMHTRGRSKRMYEEARYDDLMGEIAAELRVSLDVALGAGVPLDCLIVDPGVGFAKCPAHSYGVLARLPELAASLDRPILVGPSRKSFLREAAGDRPPAERDWATAGAVAAAVLAGAHVLRVHAVAEMVQVVRVAEEIRRNSGGARHSGPPRSVSGGEGPRSNQ
jgi:dihydropteroate synthase